MDQDIAKSIAATLRHHGDEFHAQAVEKMASERDAVRVHRDDLAKRLRNAEKMRNAFVATSVAFATQEVDAIGHGAELMRGTIAALVRALPIDPATLALIDAAITNAEIPREDR